MFLDNQSQAARIGRFSDGIEQRPPTEATLHIGRFSEGIERTPASATSDRVGTLADGVADNPEAAANRRLGSFADGYGIERGIATEAWSPLAQGNVLDDSVVAGIADKHGRSPAQVVLRWHVQRGTIVFPKSVTPARIEENFQLFDFQLEPGDIDAIDALDQGEAGRIGPNPETFASVPA